MSNEPSSVAEDLIWQNIELGYMEVVGVGDDGQIRYRVTEAGKAHLERLLGYDPADPPEGVPLSDAT